MRAVGDPLATAESFKMRGRPMTLSFWQFQGTWRFFKEMKVVILL